MKTVLFVLLLLFSVWGCATSYTHPTKDALDFEQDRWECEEIARQSLAARGEENC